LTNTHKYTPTKKSLVPNIHKNITDRKKVINILILGPYRKCQSKLLRLRDYLRSRGYENTKLVIDFADNELQHKDADIYFLEKSKEYIQKLGGYSPIYFRPRM